MIHITELLLEKSDKMIYVCCKKVKYGWIRADRNSQDPKGQKRFVSPLLIIKQPSVHVSTVNHRHTESKVFN